MGYKSAEKILPMELIELIQQYVDGDYIYIPRKGNERKGWGSNTSIRRELAKRNLDIYEDYLTGMPMNAIAEQYFLSAKSIQRIVYQTKRKIQGSNI